MHPEVSLNLEIFSKHLKAFVRKQKPNNDSIEEEKRKKYFRKNR